MSKWWNEYGHHCHWCNKPYTSKKPYEQSRFCSATCKQAHYRAFKKYVTTTDGAPKNPGANKVTQKKQKKSKKCS